MNQRFDYMPRAKNEKRGQDAYFCCAVRTFTQPYGGIRARGCANWRFRSGTRLATVHRELNGEARKQEEIMTTLSVYRDQGPQTFIPAPSIMTDDNQHEVRCGMCAREIYVDEDAYQYYTEVLVSELDNPFRCEICGEE